MIWVAWCVEEPNNENAMIESALPKGKALPLVSIEWSGYGKRGREGSLVRSRL